MGERGERYLYDPRDGDGGPSASSAGMRLTGEERRWTQREDDIRCQLPAWATFCNLHQSASLLLLCCALERQKAFSRFQRALPYPKSISRAHPKIIKVTRRRRHKNTDDETSTTSVPPLSFSHIVHIQTCCCLLFLYLNSAHL